VARRVGGFRAHKLPFGAHAKYCGDADEACVTEFVRKHTTIPVPKVLDVLYVPSSPHPERRYLMISTTIPGTPLFIQGQGHRLLHASEEQLAHVKDVISDWIKQLRTLHSPYGGRVCGFLGGSFRSYRIGEVSGPFETVAEFHAQPFSTIWPEHFDTASPHVRQLILDRPRKAYKIHLVHGDLLLHNILADNDLRPTGLIDWECAAWMPEYWEVAASTRSHFGRMWCWKDIVRDAFPRYDDDLAVDYQLQLGWDGN
jgi:aminoglycoside phosphotransferase